MESNFDIRFVIQRHEKQKPSNLCTYDKKHMFLLVNEKLLNELVPYSCPQTDLKNNFNFFQWVKIYQIYISENGKCRFIKRVSLKKIKLCIFFFSGLYWKELLKLEISWDLFPARAKLEIFTRNFKLKKSVQEYIVIETLVSKLT